VVRARLRGIHEAGRTRLLAPWSLDGVMTQVINQRPAALAYLGVERRNHNLIRPLALRELPDLKVVVLRFRFAAGDRSCPCGPSG
jgi:hypothetical protein